MFKKTILLLNLALFLNINNAYLQNPITLEDIWLNYKFFPSKAPEALSMKDGEHYTSLVNKTFLNKYEYKTGKEVSTILRSSELISPIDGKIITISDYSFSPDESKILISSKTEHIYRNSSKSIFYIWNIKQKRLELLYEVGKQRLPSFSPDGNSIAYVQDNNIFIKNLINNSVKQLTTDGKINEIINGTTDWVYEEELDITKGFEWSPDGSKIAYFRFDESKVKQYSFPIYGKLYPEEFTYKYPKAGEANSVVTINVYDVKTDKTIVVNTGDNTDIYLPRFKWTPTGELLFYRLNRLQNKLELLLANASTGISYPIYTETNKFYIEINDNFCFVGKDKFIISSEKDGYNHFYLYDIKGNLIKQLTKGNWDCKSFIGFDEKKNDLYFYASYSSSINTDVCRVNIKNLKFKIINAQPGKNEISFSSNYNYYINAVSTINKASVCALFLNNGKQLRMLEDNNQLEKTIKDYGFAKSNFITFKTNDTLELNAWMLKPLNFDSTKKYPVLVTVYGGPGNQTVINDWNTYDGAWYQMLAQKGYIIVSLDNRGTGARGEVFKKCTYKELGKYETIDQINFAKYLGTLNYVDKSRIGMFGWSYGGFMTVLCMTKGADYFKTGIAVAPVTNWRNYDNIYTERFMQLPIDNPKGYDDNSPTNFVKLLKGNLLICHGTSDDNVHVQNSMELVDALVKANKQFDMQFYPNKNHGIYGGYTRFHLYNRMTEYLLKNL